MLITVLATLAAALSTIILTPLVRAYARRRRVVDQPAIEPARRMHDRPTPLLGGLAIWIALQALIVWFTFINPVLVVHYLKPKFIIGIMAASAVLMIGGFLDDRFRLRPVWSIWFPILATLIIIGSGVGINFITRPGGGVWRLDGWKIELLRLHGLPYYFNVGADSLTFFWLMGMMYTTKLLDGLDGLTSGLTVIGAAIVMALSFTAIVHQPDTALLAGIVAGAFLGFLWYNWFPASIFLGEGGSLLAGFMLGVLAIIAGGKIATTLLIVGIPALDVVWVIIRRIVWDRTPIAAADRKHLHFRLLDAGLSPKQAVLLLWALAAVWGVLALFLQTRGKFIALIALGSVSLVFAAAVVRLERRHKVQS